MRGEGGAAFCKECRERKDNEGETDVQKTKLGISVGLLGAAIYFMGLFSGYMVAVLLAGYVLLFEENEWLKKSAVKAIAVVLSDVWVTPLFSLCFTKPIWWLIVNPENMKIPKGQKEPSL